MLQCGLTLALCPAILPAQFFLPVTLLMMVGGSTTYGSVFYQVNLLVSVSHDP